ncbi:MAG TPA: hypothetical protein VFV19_17960 [Candidatus Polarisedimenticolaceae bacterium]|nr:hypothetical protein [Candidatus Polarisedimenticolaceae bacterium]
MDRRLAEEVRASLPRGGTLFRYFRDRYALQLLAYAAAEGRSLPEMRRGRFGALFQKPSVRRLFATRERCVDWDLLDSYFPAPTQDYEITLGLWGSDRDWHWNQTSRPGFNVVLQLNFPRAHDRAYRRYIRPGNETPFARGGHPVNEDGLHTMAWARLDIDGKHGEALIEEIQTDWIRDAEEASEAALLFLAEGTFELPWWMDEVGCDSLDLFRYVEHVLGFHRRLWSEATLAASLWFLREHLGIRRIAMHTHASGCKLKRIDRRPPPRSLYENVPRAFCFERVVGAPRFLRPALPATLAHEEFWHLRL